MKKYILSAAFLLSTVAVASNLVSPWVISGDAVKSIKSNVSFAGSFSFLTGTTDPTSVAPASSPQGSLYCRTGVSGGTCYVHQDSGATTNWAQISSSVASLGNAQAKYVDKSGSDSNPCTQGAPCLTITAAQNSITDASSSKTYVIFIGPGTYLESNSYTPKDYVSLWGSGRNSTLIGHANASTITYTPPAGFLSGGSFTPPVSISFSNLQFINNFTVTRPSSGITINEEFVLGLYGSQISGNFTYNGAGIFSLFGTDLLDMWDSFVIGTTTLHQVSTSSAGGIQASKFNGTIQVDDVATNPVAFGTIASVVGSTITLTATGLNFPASGTGQMITGYGGNTHSFTYTSYNSSTGVFTGAAPCDSLTSCPNGSLPAATQKVTNYGGVATRIFNTMHTGITSRSNTSDSGASSVQIVLKGAGFGGGRITVNGINATVTGDSPGLASNLAPSFLSSATSAQITNTPINTTEFANAFQTLGTAGAGFMQLGNQSVAPTNTASTVKLYSSSGSALSWIAASDGFTRTLDGALTGNRSYNLPDVATTFAGKSGTPTAGQVCTWADSNQVAGSNSFTISGNVTANGELLSSDLKIGPASPVSAPTGPNLNMAFSDTNDHQLLIQSTNVASYFYNEETAPAGLYVGTFTAHPTWITSNNAGIAEFTSDTSLAPTIFKVQFENPNPFIEFGDIPGTNNGTTLTLDDSTSTVTVNNNLAVTNQLTTNQLNVTGLFHPASMTLAPNGPDAGIAMTGGVSWAGNGITIHPTAAFSAHYLYFTDSSNAVKLDVQSDGSVVSAGKVSGTAALLNGASSVAGTALGMKDGHVRTYQTTAPVFSVQTNAGTGATCVASSNSNDHIGAFVVTAGTGPASGSQCRMTLNIAVGAGCNLYCTITDSNGTGSGDSVSAYAIPHAVGNGGLDLYFQNAPTSGHVYDYVYSCLEAC